MTIKARKAAARILWQFTGREIQLLADLHRKTGKNFFGPLITSNISSNPILALRQLSIPASMKCCTIWALYLTFVDAPFSAVALLLFAALGSAKPAS